jgi:hypothetical protein
MILKKGDLVLMWDKRREKTRMHGNFDSLWLGPFRIEDKVGAHSFCLSDMNEEKLHLPMNGQILKLYFFDGN